MNIWRLVPGRSLRRRTNKSLRADRAVGALGSLRLRAASELRGADWRVAGIIGLVLCAPLCALIGYTTPHWLEVDLQVSAVLMGFVIALIVFLLQAAAGQSLRAAVTYRALLAASGVVWPVAFVLEFLAITAIIGRFSPENTPPPAWANTWGLIVFLVQLCAFGFAFVRLSSLVAPSGVARVMERALAEGIRAGVTARLRRLRAAEILRSECHRAGLEPAALFAPGQHVLIETPGRIHDIDLKLPKRARDRAPGGEVRLEVELGRDVTPTSVLARISGDVNPEMTKLLRNGVLVRRGGDASADWINLFREAVDLGRRAIADGSESSLDLALDILLSGLRELPRAFRLYGFEYEASTVADRSLTALFQKDNEDQVLGELRRLTEAAFSAGDSNAALQMPGLGYRIVRTGLEEDAPFLLDQGLALWHLQLRAAPTLVSEGVRQRVIDEVAELSAFTTRRLHGEVADDAQSGPARERAARCLQKLFRFETLLRKELADRGDMRSFRVAWKYSEMRQAWHPDEAVDDLEMELAAGPSEERKRELDIALTVTRESSRLAAKVAHWQDRERFLLGAWLAWRYQKGHLTEDVWRELAPFLVNAFQTDDGLDRMLADVVEVDGGARILDGWETATWDVREVSAHWVQGPTMAVFWATVLLLRATTLHHPLNVQATSAIEQLGGQLRENLNAIEADAAKWEGAVGGPVPERAMTLREAIDAVVTQEQEAHRARVAAAPVSAERVDEVADEEWLAFVNANQLRSRLEAAGCITGEVTPDAFGRPSFGRLGDKRVFLDEGRNAIVVDKGAGGRAAAVEQQEAIINGLSQIAVDAPLTGDPIAAVVSCIEAMRAAALAPDVVLIPSHYSIPPLLRQHAGFRWTHADPGTPARELGYLAGLPVLAAGTKDGNQVLVAELANVVRVTERRLPGMDRPLRASAKSISVARASAMIDAGAVIVAPAQTRDEGIGELVSWRVEVFVDLDYTVAVMDEASAHMRRVTLPARPDRRGQQDSQSAGKAAPDLGWRVRRFRADEALGQRLDSRSDE